MPLSIFNSKSAWLTIFFATAISLSIGYALLIPRFFPRGGVPENMQQENSFRVEDFLFRKEQPRIVIVGSSKAARLEAKFLPADAANLALAGYSAEFGLRLLLASEALPKIVFVELNETILRAFDPQTLNQWTSGPNYWLARHIPALRLKFRPSALLNALFKRENASLAPETGLSDNTSPPAPETLLQLQLQEGEEIPPIGEVEAHMQTIRNLLEELRQRRVRVLLFDPPMHPRVAETPRARFFRVELQRNFPVTDYEWVENTNFVYSTSDGVHLLPGSAQRYSRDLLESLR